MEFRKKCVLVLRSIFGWFLIVVGGLSGGSAVICAFAALFGLLALDSFGQRLLFFAVFLVMAVGFFTILWLGIRLKNRGREKKTTLPAKRKSSPANQKETSLPKKLKQESDTAKEQEIAAEEAEIKKIYQDFIAGEGKLPEGFSHKYNTTTPSGYILPETPFKEYLDEIGEAVDLLNNRSGISDWIYFDGHIEINTAIEMITDWAGRHRKMHARLHEKGLYFINPIYCTRKIMVVLESGDTLRNVTEKSLESCKAEEISFCTILSECELYDLIEHKAKKIEYETYPNYHDETYADWWFVDSDRKVPE